MLLTAVAIKLDSRGPVHLPAGARRPAAAAASCAPSSAACAIDAEQDGVARWASEGRPARSPVSAAFLRKSRIDELPQLWSVFTGEMSLVGPRPERPAFVEELKEQIPFYEIRHTVKPGITGWAQVRYHYGVVDGRCPAQASVRPVLCEE